MIKKQNIFWLFLITMGWIMPAGAQVFSGAPSAPQQIVQPQKPTAQPLGALDEQPTPSQTSAETDKNTDTFSPVEKNFNNENQQKELQNTASKVVHFRIVDGKVDFDSDDKRSILVYYDNYQIHRGFDKMVKCTIRVYVLNDFKEKITSLGFKLKWPDIATSVEMSQLKPGVSTYTDLMLLGEGCLHLDKTPTIEVNRCRIRGISQETCADAIKWFPKKH